MAMTGLQINKLLPGTNCKECGSSTCLAFAMKLASKKTDLSECPYASDEAREVLGAAAEPPVKTIKLGMEGKTEAGGETCLYRHEKTFVNQTLLGVCIRDDMGEEEINRRLESIRDYEMERVGEMLRLDVTGVEHADGEPDEFAALASKAWSEAKLPLVLRSKDADALKAASKAVEGSGSILAPEDGALAEDLAETAKKHGHSLSVTAEDLDTLIERVESLKNNGFESMVLELPVNSIAERLQVNSIARRAALKNEFKPLGFPFLTFVTEGEDAYTTAATEVAKYGGICLLPHFDPAELAPLMTLRQNIYTDPQKPIQVEPGLYPIGEPDEQSPVFVTTNFSLTYFVVSGEVENAGVNGWLVVPECEGMSVLTAWAAGKFSGAGIAKFVKEHGVEEQCKRNEIIIPGHVAQISGELEEELPGWKVVVGPQEAVDIESFANNYLKAG
jgi:acetyl-CoA decarbonylase/synthase complex subunit gamma